MSTSLGIEVITYNKTTAQVASEVANEIANEAAQELVDALREELQPQIDGQIMSWFYNYNPTLTNEPAILWQTESEKSDHLGDLFYNTDTGSAFRFSIINDIYVWDLIKDTAVTEALAMAARAQDTADHKKRIFITPVPNTDPPFTPTAPYDIGDLWAQGIEGDLKRCTNGNSIEGTYIASDWDLATKYTDDTALFDFVDTTYALDKESLQSQIDGKIETWFQVTDPNVWTTQEERNYHSGDMWFRTDLGYLYRYNSELNLWQQIQDSKTIAAYDIASKAKDTADRKRTVFYAEPYVPYDAGDLWTVPVDYPDDISIQNELMKCIMPRTQSEYYNRSDWDKATKYTDDTAALDAQQAALDAFNMADEAANAASSAYFLAKAKSKSFTAQPTTPYTVGDLWQDGVNLKTCITSRLTGSYVSADWTTRVNYDSTAITMNNGIVTAGSLRVKDGNNVEWGGIRGGGTPDQIAFWLGANFSNAASAPFWVKHNGTMYATAGSIAGWTITGNRLVKDTGNNIDSCGMTPIDYPFYSGATYANRASAPFRVTIDGSVYLSKVNISTSPTGQRFELNSSNFTFYNDSGTGYFRVSVSSIQGLLLPKLEIYSNWFSLNVTRTVISAGEFLVGGTLLGWPEARFAIHTTNTLNVFMISLPQDPAPGSSGLKIMYWRPSDGQVFHEA